MHAQRQHLRAGRPPLCELARGLVDDPGGERLDVAAFFGQRDEDLGADRPALRVLPACQCFKAAQTVRFQVEQRLVHDRQLTLADGTPQVAFELELLGDALVHALVEQHHPAPAVGLGRVHRQVGVTQHFVGGAVAEVAEGDADAAAGHQLGAVDYHRRRQHVEQPLRQRQRSVGRADVFEQHREFVAAEARHQVARPHAVGQPACHLAQQQVAGDVAQTVVDELEAVEVEEHHREALRGIGAAAFHGHAQALVEAVAVRQVGQAVVIGHMVQRALGEPARSDVVKLVDQGARLARVARVPRLAWVLRVIGGIGEAAAVQRDPGVLPGRRTAAQFDRERFLGAARRRRRAAPQQFTVTVVQQLGKGPVQQLGLGAAEQRTQGQVHLVDAAILAHDGHADGGVRECGAEALQVQRGLALCLRHPRLLGLEFGLVAAQRKPRQHHHGGHHRARHHQHRRPEQARVQRQHAGHGGGDQVDRGPPAVLLGPVAQRQALAFLGGHHRQQRQGGAGKVGQGDGAQGCQADRCSGPAGPRQYLFQRLEGQAANGHRRGGRSRRADPAAQALGAAHAAHQPFGASGDCRGRCSVQGQQPEHEHIGHTDRIFGARNVHLEEGRQHRAADAEQHLRQIDPGQRDEPREGPGCGQRAAGRQCQPQAGGSGVVVEQVAPSETAEEVDAPATHRAGCVAGPGFGGGAHVGLIGRRVSKSRAGRPTSVRSTINEQQTAINAHRAAGRSPTRRG